MLCYKLGIHSKNLQSNAADQSFIRITSGACENTDFRALLQAFIRIPQDGTLGLWASEATLSGEAHWYGLREKLLPSSADYGGFVLTPVTASLEGRLCTWWLPAIAPCTLASHRPQILAKANEPLGEGSGHLAFS